MKVWFITGISRGLGLALARAVLASGDKLVGTVRSTPPALDAPAASLRILRADLANPDAAESVTCEAFAAFGRVDVLVNNAGYGLLGAVETLSDSDLRSVFEVDVFAPIRICRTALGYFRAQGNGHILNVTSIAGRAPGPATAAYAAAKHAMEGFSASLAQEVGPLGIKVTAIAPGQFRTEFLDGASSHISDDVSDAYDVTVGQAMASLRRVNHKQIGDPDAAARVILAVARSGAPPVHMLLGSDALHRARDKMAAMDREMRAWEAQTVSTDFS